MDKRRQPDMVRRAVVAFVQSAALAPDGTRYRWKRRPPGSRSCRGQRDAGASGATATQAGRKGRRTPCCHTLHMTAQSVPERTAEAKKWSKSPRPRIRARSGMEPGPCQVCLIGSADAQAGRVAAMPGSDHDRQRHANRPGKLHRCLHDPEQALPGDVA